MDIVKYTEFNGEMIDFFTEAIHNTELRYTCRDLYASGIDTESEMRLSIIKSMQVLQQVGLNPRHHFKHIFITDIKTGNTYSDWRISKIGVLLALMHASGDNPLLCKLKIEMLRVFK